MKALTRVSQLKIGEFYEVRGAKCMLTAIRIERKSYRTYYPKVTNDGFRFVREHDRSEFVVTRHKIGLQWDMYAARKMRDDEAAVEHDKRCEDARNHCSNLVKMLKARGVVIEGAGQYLNPNHYNYRPIKIVLNGNDARFICDLLESIEEGRS